MTAKPLTALEKSLLSGHHDPDGLNPVDNLDRPIVPHPDGKPWDKCCTYPDNIPPEGLIGCQCFMAKDPTSGSSRFDHHRHFNQRIMQAVFKAPFDGTRFMCCHRSTDDGYHRECAGWAAKFGHKR